jgi:putative Mg2+ transporter-C (MgtC) family protein
MDLAHLNPRQMIEVVVAIGAAYLFALPLGWERKARGVAKVGLRTLPLVSVGTCAYVLISRYLYASGVFEADGQARTLRAMMTGIGFIGGGAILKQARAINGVGGIATGASVWTTGALGASVAYGYYEVALALVVTHVLVIDVTDWVGRRARAKLEGKQREAERQGDQP